MLRFIELFNVDLKSMTQFLKYTAVQVLIGCTYELRSVPTARKFPVNSKYDTSHPYPLHSYPHTLNPEESYIFIFF